MKFPSRTALTSAIAGIAVLAASLVHPATVQAVTPTTAPASLSAAVTDAPTALTTNSRVNPIGINPNPILAWQSSVTTQTAYQIRVATTVGALDTANVWDSTPVASASSSEISYAGPELSSRQSVAWQVRTWDISGAVSDWSAPATWEMGLLNRSDWSGRWITSKAWAATPVKDASDPPLPIFVRHLQVTGTIVQARMYIAGPGGFVATVNGQPASPAVLEPGYDTFSKRTTYSTYDVTSLLQQGGNTFGVQLSTGVYDEAGTPGRYRKLQLINGPIGFKAQIEITYADGTKTVVNSDPSWSTRPGATLVADWYGGEDYVGGTVPADWDTAGGTLDRWDSAVAANIPDTAEMTARIAAPIEVVGKIATVSWTQPQPRVWVADLGTQLAGWPQLTVSGPAGTTVKMVPSEKLDSNGLAFQRSMGNTVNSIFDTYRLSGVGVETWHPQFVYHGFRYLQVTGLPSAPTSSTITGIVVRTANPVTGTFNASNPTVSKLHTIINRAMASNMFSVLTDCPDREKLGWLEEDWLVFDALAGNYDMSAYGRQIEQKIADSQQSDGSIPEFAPQLVVYTGWLGEDPDWSGVVVFLPWKMYQNYGDTATMRAYYPNMVNYMKHLATEAQGNLMPTALGDWGTTKDTRTLASFVDSVAYKRLASTMASIAGVLGKTADQQTYTTLAANITDAINTGGDAKTNTKYLTTHGDYGPDQGSNALALDNGIVPASDRASTTAALLNSLAANGGQFKAGEVSLPSIIAVLSALGRDDLIYTAVAEPGHPLNYAGIVASGATALTEQFGGTATPDSQNHFMLGGVDAWLTGHLAGIQQTPGTVGWRNVIINPSMVAGLNSASATRVTGQGTISSSWTRSGNTATVAVAIPANTTATIVLPSGTRTVGPGSYTFTTVASPWPNQPRPSGLLLQNGSQFYRYDARTGALLSVTDADRAALSPMMPTMPMFLVKASWAPSIWLIIEPKANPSTWVAQHLTPADWATMNSASFRIGNVPGTLYGSTSPFPDIWARTPDGATHLLTAAEKSQLGSPAADSNGVLWVKYGWDPTVWQITVWADGVRTAARATPAAYARFHSPSTTATVLVPGAALYKLGTAPALYLRTPNGVVHHLSKAEWKALGYPGYQIH